jgi:hypothetical protein
MALGDKAAFDARDTPQNAATRNEHALVSDIGFCAAVAFGATGLVLFLTGSDRKPEFDGLTNAASQRTSRERASRTASVTAAPLVGPHTTGAGLLVRF